MTAAEDRERARNQATGEFGTQPHAESGIVPVIAPLMFSDAMRDLEAWVDSDEVFAIRVLVGKRGTELLHQLEKSRGSRVWAGGPVLDHDNRISIALDGPTIASYTFGLTTPEVFMKRADEVALALRTIPQARTAMGMHTPTAQTDRVRVVLVCPQTTAPFTWSEETLERQLVTAVRPVDDDSVNDLLNAASVMIVADYTPWCMNPDDHCVRGDCWYGPHGPVTAEAEDDLRAGGYGWVLDDAEGD